MKHQLTFSSLRYAIENTAPQNTGNPLYIRLRYIETSRHTPHYDAALIVFGHCIFYGMKQKSYSTLSRGIPSKILLATCIF